MLIHKEMICIQELSNIFKTHIFTLKPLSGNSESAPIMVLVNEEHIITCRWEQQVPSECQSSYHVSISVWLFVKCARHSLSLYVFQFLKGLCQ